MVMLHGCGQDAEALAASTKMNRIAASKRFFVLYPEQERLSNVQACWNWYGTRSGQAQREADSIDAAIDQVCLLQPVDRDRIVLAGISAGASMAALLATRRPQRFRMIAMHSGIAPGVAYSSATAVMAMLGRKVAARPFPVGAHLPALLVIHGSADHVVAPGNGLEAARLWAAHAGAIPRPPRTVQRGARYTATITDYRTRDRFVASLCQIDGLAHAWSGGAPGYAYSDPKGPDASRMIWAFAIKQFPSDGK
jgi:poly(hydroxyalkanoate) depolymerase family esterase